MVTRSGRDLDASEEDVTPTVPPPSRKCKERVTQHGRENEVPQGTAPQETPLGTTGASSGEISREEVGEEMEFRRGPSKAAPTHSKGEKWFKSMS